MNPSSKESQYMRLGTFCGILARTDLDPGVYEKASELARELFPPKANPLEFSGSNIEQCAHTGYEQGYLLYFNHRYKDWIAQWRVHGNNYQFLQPYKFAELAEAVSACEAHHQARFREMCA